MNKERFAWLKEGLWVLLGGLVSGLLLFVPSLSKLGGENRGVFGQLGETFFHSSEKEALLGDGVDPIGSFWIVGFVEEILGGERNAIDDRLYAPYGLDLGMNEGYAWLDTLFAMPLRWLIGSPGFYNLHVLCTLSFSFAACHLSAVSLSAMCSQKHLSCSSLVMLGPASSQALGPPGMEI